jgi:hypothetical protein
MPVILALGRLKPEDWTFEANLSQETKKKFMSIVFGVGLLTTNVSFLPSCDIL